MYTQMSTPGTRFNTAAFRPACEHRQFDQALPDRRSKSHLVANLMETAGLALTSVLVATVYINCVLNLAGLGL